TDANDSTVKKQKAEGTTDAEGEEDKITPFTIQLPAKIKYSQELIELIPAADNELLAFPLDWSIIDEKKIVENTMEAWLNQRFAQYLGKEAQDLTKFVVGLLNNHFSSQQIASQLKMVLEKDTQAFMQNIISEKTSLGHNNPLLFFFTPPLHLLAHTSFYISNCVKAAVEHPFFSFCWSIGKKNKTNANEAIIRILSVCGNEAFKHQTYLFFTSIIDFSHKQYVCRFQNKTQTLNVLFHNCIKLVFVRLKTKANCILLIKFKQLKKTTPKVIDRMFTCLQDKQLKNL
ncbi:hypothetical protein RFI_08556, partial [Reticulomyxa filosa]